MAEMDYAASSEMDVAYHVLLQKGEPIFYKDLVMKVIELKRKPVQSLSAGIAEVYTLVNMDSRFHYEGDGLWGLTEWNPPEVKRTHGARASAASRTASKNSRRREKLLEGIQEE